MCNRLGKKHRRYVGTAGLEQDKNERMHRAPWRRLCDSYKVRMLNETSNLSNKYWDSNQRSKGGVETRLTSAKSKFYAKLDKYYFRAGSGR